MTNLPQKRPPAPPRPKGHKITDLKSLRKMRRLSQADMAQLLNMSQGNYSKLEKGRSELKLTHLQALSKAFDIEFHIQGQQFKYAANINQ